jgi:Na+-transporting NADH:ubiquinone oxidoreductase subunit C
LKNNIYTLFFAATLGIVCAALLTATAEFTEPYKRNNEKAEMISNVLGILKVSVETDATAAELIEIFEANVFEEEKGELTVYSYRPAGQADVEAVAFPFSGPGLWAAIEGFLALESDMKTIRGISFYKQEETPGLGGEIGADWFQSQFIGKSIADQSGKAGIIINKADAGQNQVDGITGATMTCDKVEEMLNNVIDKISKEAN